MRVSNVFQLKNVNKPQTNGLINTDTSYVLRGSSVDVKLLFILIHFYLRFKI